MKRSNILKNLDFSFTLVPNYIQSLKQNKPKKHQMVVKSTAGGVLTIIFGVLVSIYFIHLLDKMYSDLHTNNKSLIQSNSFEEFNQVKNMSQMMLPSIRMRTYSTVHQLKTRGLDVFDDEESSTEKEDVKVSMDKLKNFIKP